MEILPLDSVFFQFTIFTLLYDFSPLFKPPLLFFPNFSIFLEISFHGEHTSIHPQPHY